MAPSADISILDVDLIRFESGGRDERRAVVEGVMRSLGTGFVYVRHDVPADVIDAAYGLLRDFFHLPDEVKRRHVAPASMGQTGYTELLVETAAGRDVADWKEMLNWGLARPGAPRHQPDVSRTKSRGSRRTATPWNSMSVRWFAALSESRGPDLPRPA